MNKYVNQRICVITKLFQIIGILTECDGYYVINDGKNTLMFSPECIVSFGKVSLTIKM